MTTQTITGWAIRQDNGQLYTDTIYPTRQMAKAAIARVRGFVAKPVRVTITIEGDG